ncbi:MAG: ankyrin repeat domain-containing protein [Planctomycetota bacterium]
MPPFLPQRFNARHYPSLPRNSDPEWPLGWLCGELLADYLDTGSTSVIDTYIPILDEFERHTVLVFLFGMSLYRGERRLAQHCVELGYSLAPVEASDCGPLHDAMWYCGDRPDVFGWLLDHGAELERRDLSYGNATPLIRAVWERLESVVRLLVERGADVNARTLVDDDRTALMIAAEAGSHEVVKLLLAHGAQAELQDRWGRTADEFADSAGHDEIGRTLRRATLGRGTGRQS